MPCGTKAPAVSVFSAQIPAILSHALKFVFIAVSFLNLTFGYTSYELRRYCGKNVFYQHLGFTLMTILLGLLCVYRNHQKQIKEERLTQSRNGLEIKNARI